MKKQSEQKEINYKEIAEKHCKKCIYSENCEESGQWKTCKHIK